ncbi:MAG TPA: hypothetical protein VGR02_10415 [Thermoanaerobaculia bacterium]|jgi:hypothetical protein|nr:hypothetical protein [Thermoanaerobaculia bacterium]
MTSRRALTALIVVQLLAFAASAQESAEYGRATGREVVLTPKGSAPFSGSLELSLGSSPRYGVTAGGSLMQDRLWFFASASQQHSRLARINLPENATTSAVGARLNAQIGDSHDFSAFFDTARRPELSTFTGTGPSSLFSLHYNGLVSSNMLFSASFTRSERRVGGVGTLVP